MGTDDEYSQQKPIGGRSAADPNKLARVKTAPRVAVASRPENPTTPIQELINRLDDLKTTLQESSAHLTPEQQKNLAESSIRKFERAQKAATAVKAIIALIVLVFGAGITYALWFNSVATDAEVHDVVNSAIIDHNGGYDPDALNGDGQPQGNHPDMRKAIKQNSQTIREVTDAVGNIQDELPKIDMRGEYQFEFSRWQAQVTECERKHCKYPPPKPDRVTELERKLMFGNYGESKRKLTGDP